MAVDPHTAQFGVVPAGARRAFKAYDIRGRVPDELNAAVAYRLGRGLGRLVGEGAVAVCRDMRPTGQALVDALTAGLLAGGNDVADLGVGGTEEIYHAVAAMGYAAGVAVTASHNPIDYNGMKLVRAGARPISGDSGLDMLRELAVGSAPLSPAGTTRRRTVVDLKRRYAEHLLSYVDTASLKPLRILVNPGNGAAGYVLSLLEPHLPFEFIKINFEPDGTFPNGIPNPLLPERRAATERALMDSGADLALAWDGDFDRCFFWDERGRFVEGYYVVGLIARSLLARAAGGRVVHDPRLYWNTVEVVRAAGGEPVLSKTGHAFIKERMRTEDAVYGGEMSSHHYFRDFAYCDSGMIPWLLVAAMMSETRAPLSALVDESMRRFPCSGEINRTVGDPDSLLARLEGEYGARAELVDHTDGVSFEFRDWRCNVRKSNTEPLVRVNVEARGDAELMRARTGELLARIDALA